MRVIVKWKYSCCIYKLFSDNISSNEDSSNNEYSLGVLELSIAKEIERGIVGYNSNDESLEVPDLLIKTKEDNSNDKSLGVPELIIKIAKQEINDKSVEEVSTENVLTSTEILSNYELLSNPNIWIADTRATMYDILY